MHLLARKCCALKCEKVNISFLVPILIGGGGVYYFHQKNQLAIDANQIVYNSITQQWETFAHENQLGTETRKEMVNDLDQVAANNQTVINGYLDHCVAYNNN